MADTDLGAGAPVNLRFVPIPDGASFVDPVQWSVSDESRATIAPNGAEAMVTPVDGANGEVTVTATSGVATDTHTISWAIQLTGGRIEVVNQTPTPTPTEPAPVEPAPVEPAPTEPAPAPVEPTPAPQPAPNA